MPRYDYDILGDDGNPTGTVVEIIQSIHEEPLVEHGGKRVRRKPIQCSVSIHGGYDRNDDDGKSMELCFEPNEDLFKQVPSLRGCIDQKGHVHFRSKQHRATVYKQIDSARRSAIQKANDLARCDAFKESDYRVPAGHKSGRTHTPIPQLGDTR